MSANDNRPEPQSTVQVAGRVAEGLVAGLNGSPALMGLLLLNVIGLGAGAWFLSALAQAQGERWNALLKACLTKIGEL